MKVLAKVTSRTVTPPDHATSIARPAAPVQISRDEPAGLPTSRAPGAATSVSSISVAPGGNCAVPPAARIDRTSAAPSADLGSIANGCTFAWA